LETDCIIPACALSTGRQIITIQDEDLQQWSSFWQQGFITTFGASKPNNYDGVVLDFWQEKFSELPQGARILDIACGNGAIGTIAAEISRSNKKDFFIASTDRAVINSELVGDDDARELRNTIQFHSRTPCEMQPFAADSFDLVTSQFGFEYSDIRKTLAEVRRILRSNARFVAISHHADSTLIKAAKIELDIYALAMDELDILGTASRYFDVLGAVNTSSSPTESLASDVNDKMNTFRTAYPQHECSLFILGTISFIARSVKQTTADERRIAINRAKSDFEFARARLDDMIRAAMDDEKIEVFSIAAKETGFKSTHCLKIYGEDEGLAGWQIHLK
jgi:SAM-dependent methyltransferase